MPIRSDKTKLDTRLRPLYGAAFLQGFVFWYAIEKIFMKSIGIDDAGIALIIIVFTAVMTVANLPFGILADRWSRKGILIVASLLLAAGTLIDGLSSNIWAYLIGSCLWGMYFACYTGTYDSVIYDTLAEEGHASDRFAFYYGKVQLYDGTALVLSSLVATVLSTHLPLSHVYFWTIPFSLLSLFFLLRFKEPVLHKSSEPQLLHAHIRQTMAAVLQRQEIIWLVLSLISLTIATRLLLEFDQLWLIALALPLVLYGPVNALLLSAYGGSGMAANRIQNKRWIILGTGLGMVVASLALPFHTLWLTIAAICFLIAGIMTLEVLLSRRLHDALPSRIRAGASSTVITIGYAAFIPVGLGFGLISKHGGIFTASWIPVALCVCIALCVAAAHPRSKNI